MPLPWTTRFSGVCSFNAYSCVVVALKSPKHTGPSRVLHLLSSNGIALNSQPAKLTVHTENTKKHLFTPALSLS